MRPPMSKGVLEEVKSEITWGKARTRPYRKRESRVVHAKVARWAEEEYDNMPYFIKVIGRTSDYSYHTRNHGTILKLPTSFTRENYLKLDKDVTLEDAVNGSTWKVSFRAQGYIEWTRGFPEFSQQNSLQCSNIIVFALVVHSRFLFTLFDDQGCQIIHPFRAKQEIKLSSEEKCEVNRSSFHLPSCPKHHTRRVEPKLEFQEDAANTSLDVKHADEELAAQKTGHDKSCQAALLFTLRQPKRKFKALASSAQDNHHICIHMGFSCGVHHRHEAKPKIQPVNQTLDQCEDSALLDLNQTLDQCEHSDLLDQCQRGLQQIQIAESMDTNQPLVQERALSEMTMSEANSESGNTFEVSYVQRRKAAHLDPIWFTFMSRRRVVTNGEKREAKSAASRYSRTLRRPNSITVMKESHVYKEFIMELPKALVLLGSTVECPQPALVLVDSVGRSWEMQWYASSRHRLALVPKDWALFAVHHFLEEGDACVFEATDIEALTILVRIFRVVDKPDKLGTDGIYTHYSVELAF